MASERFCTFWVDGQLFGAPVTQVQEVIAHPPMTRIPLAHPAIRGMMNLRGQIVMAIDLRRRIGISKLLPGAPPVHVVVRMRETAVSLIVDEIGEVLEATEGNWELLPETVSAKVRAVVRGIYKEPHRLLLALDLDRVVCLDDAMSSRTRECP